MKTLFKYLIYAMIALAVFNITYNSVKTVSEIREWGGLTDKEKRHKIYGDYYTFLVLIQENTQPDDKVLIYSNDTDKWKTFFQSIYYLYPRRITTTIDKSEFQTFVSSKKFRYIAAFNSSIQTDSYQKIASFSATQTSNYGSVYKIK